MSHCDNDYLLIVLSENYLKRITTQEKVPMSLVAKWKPLGIGLNGFKGLLKFKFKLFGSLNTPLSIPI